ncbi:MAG: LamG domain-containing protein [Sphaerochaeta sp.]|jgi:hypothetical protein|nr:LamG domain-containing protein [Sphaerochaeta sp.]
MTAVFKLVCGLEELDLNSGYYQVAQDGPNFPERATQIELKIAVVAGASQTGALQRLKRNIDKFLDKARRYTATREGEPVDFVVKLDDGLPDVEPLYGRSHMRRRVLDGVVQLAKPMRGHPIQNLGRLQDTVLVLLVRPYWHGKDIVVGNATGWVKEVDEKGVEIWEGTTNLITNPCFALPTDWDSGWTSSSATVAQSTTAWRSLGSSARISCGSTAAGQLTQAATLASGSTYRISAYVSKEGSVPDSTDLVMWGNGASLSTTFGTEDTTHPDWYRATASFAGASTSATHGVQVQAGRYVFVDDVQLEQKNYYATPFCNGELLGCIWTTASLPHASTSTRTAGYVSIPNTCVYPDHGTITMWFKPGLNVTEYADYLTLMHIHGDSHAESIELYMTAATDRFSLLYNHNNVVNAASQSFSAGDEIFIATSWDATNDDWKLYLNGTTTDHLAMTLRAPQWSASDVMYIGAYWDTTLMYQMNGAIYDLRTWPTVLSASEVAAIRTAGRGLGEMPVLWSAAANGIAYNHEDSGHTGTTYLMNIPGELPAGMKLWLDPDPNSTSGSGHQFEEMWVGFYPLSRGDYQYKAKYFFEAEQIGASDTWDVNLEWAVSSEASQSNVVSTQMSSGSFIQEVRSASGNTTGILYPERYEGSEWKKQGQWRLFARAAQDTGATSIWTMKVGGVGMGGGGQQYTRSFDTQTIPVMAACARLGYVDLGIVDIPPTDSSQSVLTKKFAEMYPGDTTGYDWITFNTSTTAAGSTYALWMDAMEILPSNHLCYFKGLTTESKPLFIDSTEETQAAYTVQEVEEYTSNEWYAQSGAELRPNPLYPQRMFARHTKDDFIIVADDSGSNMLTKVYMYLQPRFTQLR